MGNLQIHRVKDGKRFALSEYVAQRTLQNGELTDSERIFALYFYAKCQEETPIYKKEIAATELNWTVSKIKRTYSALAKKGILTTTRKNVDGRLKTIYTLSL